MVEEGCTRIKTKKKGGVKIKNLQFSCVWGVKGFKNEKKAGGPSGRLYLKREITLGWRERHKCLFFDF
jgi:hypothetical protein